MCNSITLILVLGGILKNKKMKKYVVFLFVILLSCTTKQNKKDTQLAKQEKTIQTSNDTVNNDTEIIETFTDSLSIGEKGKSKIQIIKYRVFDSKYVLVKFYTKGASYWEIQNTYMYECEALEGLEPEIRDFNNDSFNDITFISLTAARGANEVRRLFVYDKENKSLTSILNSEEYPNIRYNKELDCIDAFLVYGGTTTVFARIQKDSLKDFAKVSNEDNYRTVYEINKTGKVKVIRKDRINEDGIFTRYINYKPLHE